jgi:putative oxidoreductase
MINGIKKCYEALISCGTVLQSLLLLAMRLYWGGSFALSGWGKLHHIEGVSGYFASLGIPFPTLNAYFVGGMEFIGGLCLLLGFASRLAAIPLIVIMIVALLTEHYEALINAFSDPQTFIRQYPFNYLLTALIVLAFGPGKISVDAVLKRFFREN